VIFALFTIAVAAAEAAVGLALIILIYRHYRTTRLQKVDFLKG
jgi:NADH-quinone oxidoreductase subunit K